MQNGVLVKIDPGSFIIIEHIHNISYAVFFPVYSLKIQFAYNSIFHVRCNYIVNDIADALRWRKFIRHARAHKGQVIIDIGHPVMQKLFWEAPAAGIKHRWSHQRKGRYHNNIIDLFNYFISHVPGCIFWIVIRCLQFIETERFIYSKIHLTVFPF